MRVIITGGSGIIGRELTRSLTADKHEVIILSRNPEWVVGLPSGARAVEWDTKTANGWGSLVNGSDAIINLAGETIGGEGYTDIRWSKKRKERILNSRINAGKAVTEAIRAAVNKPSVLIQASAVGFYGSRGDEDITESVEAGNDFTAKVCKQWEDSTIEVAQMGVRRCVVRMGIALSMKGGALPRQALPFKLLVGGPIGSGKQWYSWVHMQDVVGAIRFLIQNPEAEGVFNLTAPKPLSNSDFGREIAHVLGRPFLFPIPGFVFKIAFGEASKTLLEGQRVLPAHLSQAGFEFQFTDARTALKDLLKPK